MERRTFIGGGAAAIAAVATAGCSGSSLGIGSGDTSTVANAAKTTGTGKLPAAAANWTALARDLDGTLVRPGDASWKTAHQLYNTRFDNLKPAAVAYVANADDIRSVLSYARAHSIKVAIRNGGHSYAG